MEVFMKSKVSVALCTYNGSEYIEEQLQSILNQTRSVDEIVITDDHSTDDTVAKVKKVLDKCDVASNFIVNEVNQGFSKNFINTMKRCTGDIIFFSDQDDVWVEQKVEKMAGKMELDGSLLVFSSGYVTDENLNIKSETKSFVNVKKDYFENRLTTFDHLLSDNFVSGSAMAISKKLVDALFPFDECWPHDYWIAVVASIYGKLSFVDEPLYMYRQHSSNTIGMRPHPSLDTIKRIFIHDKDGDHVPANDALLIYADARIPQLLFLKKYLNQRSLSPQYLNITDRHLDFWQRRIDFSKNGVMKNFGVAIASTVKGEQKKNRNHPHPVIDDFMKAIALSHTNKKL